MVKTQHLTIRLEEADVVRLRRYAEEDGTAVATLVRTAVLRYLRDREREEASP
jgi:hypothetical protein